MDLALFKDTDNFYVALQQLFKSSNIPVSYIDEKSMVPYNILKEHFKPDNYAHKLMKDVFILGMINEDAFTGLDKMDEAKIEQYSSDDEKYDGILIFGVTLKKRENNLLPTRGQLAEITRSFNRAFPYIPVVVVFSYENHIALANAERLKYKQTWREGEKIGKVSILRDVNIEAPHTGHIKILRELNIAGKTVKVENKSCSINNYTALYIYWQQVFDVSILNKQFYKELSDWYFWAIREVYYPDAPYQAGFGADALLDPELREHNAKHLIRLLTRILFVWFIKEKGLIPEELFDEDYIANDLLKDYSPIHDELFNVVAQESRYYKAILQNLFFATLNQEMHKREFRKYGKPGQVNQHRNVTNLMRYKSYFKKPDKFVKLVENTVPFMNGGLFDCLDAPVPEMKSKRGGEVIKYIDGFSDRKDNVLRVPDYIFFGKKEHVNLSEDYGQGKNKNKDLAVKGLIDILKSYKFTIAENTPIEEDVALDPELLGKVFENLLASYNPETKTTARKQTGSFYTPREIVNYMVDESLIAFLKNSLKEIIADGHELDDKLQQLFSYSNAQPFDKKCVNIIIKAFDECKILDPACGSGAFPMGILQKMVHVLSKIDHNNGLWEELQLQKADAALAKESDKVKVKELEQLKDDVIRAFDENEADYPRKLCLVENCIYGVDIQSIATQISKLRFFISLIVDQRVDKSKENFGIRPLPNLESKFVAANTLIGINKEENTLFETDLIRGLKSELKDVRHRLFQAKTPSTKRKLREQDEHTRKLLAQKLADIGMDHMEAEKLAQWDPYDQNASSSFCDPEWMFGIKDGFDIVIGNPPYVQLQNDGGKLASKYGNAGFETFVRTGDIYSLFYERGCQLLRPGAYLCYITSNKWMRAGYGKATRQFFSERTKPILLIDFAGQKIFESATVDTNILLFQRKLDSYVSPNTFEDTNDCSALAVIANEKCRKNLSLFVQQNAMPTNFPGADSWIILSPIEQSIKNKIETVGVPLRDWNVNIYRGILTGYNEAFIIDEAKRNEIIANCKTTDERKRTAELIRPILRGRDIKRYEYAFASIYLIVSHNGYNDPDGNWVPRINIV